MGVRRQDAADRSDNDEPERSAPPVSERAERALEEQRAAHEPSDCDVDDEGVGALINNTGLDGDAATG